jgi:uncharacterized phiE125 gp8 family phage protein
MTADFSPRRVHCLTPPSTLPVSLAQTKQFLRIDQTTEDELISLLIATATQAAQQFLSSSLLTQTWQLTYHDTTPTMIPLPMRPVQAVTEIHTDGTVIPSTAYQLNAAKDCIICESYLNGEAITINYTAGYGDNEQSVPAPIRQAILAHVASMYDDRSNEALPATSRALLQPYREVRL